LRNTKIEWYWLPATAGIAFIGGLQSYRMYATAQAKKEEEDNASLYSDEGEEEPGKKPKKRQRIRPSGPWCV
jgi:phosphatidylserine decarboxylase